MTPTITEADVREAIRAHFFAPEGLMLEVLRTARRAALKREMEAAHDEVERLGRAIDDVLKEPDWRRRYNTLAAKQRKTERRVERLFRALEATWKETP